MDDGRGEEDDRDGIPHHQSFAAIVSSVSWVRTDRRWDYAIIFLRVL